MDRPWLVALACAALLALQQLARWRHRLAGRWRARRRGRRAAQGERDAEVVLARHGYRVEARQAHLSWPVECAGVAHHIGLRADLIVTRRRRRFVAEVKTGDQAPRIESAATRRQLLEYRVAYGVDGALLVDVEDGAVSEVVFPGLAAAAAPGWGQLGLGFGVGVVLGWLLAN